MLSLFIKSYYRRETDHKFNTAMICRIMLLLPYLVMSVMSMATVSSTTRTQPTPSTVIDVLSSKAEYSYFLRQLQVNGMIPTINSLQNITLLAPVNSAFAVEREQSSKLGEESLLRYIIDQRVRVAYLERNEAIFATRYNVGGHRYYLKISPDSESQEYVVDDVAHIVEADIHAKHQYSFIQSIDHLLEVKPSVCDVLMDRDLSDMNGYSISMFKSLFQSLFCTDLHNERDTISKEEERASCQNFLKKAGTIFIPTDNVFQQYMSDIEIRYYLALFHSLSNPNFKTTKAAQEEIRNDISDLLLSLSVKEPVAGLNVSKHTYSSLNKAVHYNIGSNHRDKIIINQQIESVGDSSNIVLSDCIVHLFDSVPVNFFDVLKIELAPMIPRKALFALHFSNFVKELQFRSLDYLIDGSSSNQTILLDVSQKDDVLESDFNIASFSSKQELLFQFIEGYVDVESRLSQSDYDSIFLLEDSKLCSKKLIDSCFKQKLSASYTGDSIDMRYNDEIDIVCAPARSLNETIIYLLNGEVSPPGSLKRSMGDLLSNGYVSRHKDEFSIEKSECLQTLDYLLRFHLFSLDENHNGYSLFLPCYPQDSSLSHGIANKGVTQNAWKSLGLVLDYLTAHPDELRKVVQGLVLEDTLYSNFDQTDSEVYNLNGDKMTISVANESTHDTNVLRINDTAFNIPFNSDILFNHGVIHIVDKVLFPNDFSITLLDLVETTFDSGASKISFIDLLNKVPQLKYELGLSNEMKSNYSLIIPRSKSLNSINNTAETSRFLDILETHIIPNTQLEPLLSCIYGDSQSSLGFPGQIILTNHSETVFTCRKDKSGGRIKLQLHKYSESTKTLSASGNTISLVSHGCTSMNRFPGPLNDTSCVFMVTQPFDLKKLEASERNFLHIHIRFLSVGVGIVLGIIIFGGIFVVAVLCFSSSSPRKGTDANSYNPDQFMRVTTDEVTPNYDNGYETDIGNLINENDTLLPYANRSFYNNYGTTDRDDLIESTSTAPRRIKAVNISKALNRERNLPGM